MTSRYALTLCFLLVACGGDEEATVRIDARTDYLPGVEFAEVEVGFDTGGPSATYPVSFGEDFLRGVRVATLEGISPGRVVVRGRLIAADGTRLAERRMDIELRGGLNTIPALLFTRDCSGVACGDGETCFNGGCVSVDCSSENLSACGEGCQTADDCRAPRAGCARSLCDDGACFVGSEVGDCGTGEFCHPDRGCVVEPMESDGGVSTRDMGTTDPSCGQPCAFGDACEIGVYDCSEGAPVCVSAGPAPTTTECRPAAGECDRAERCDGVATTCPTNGYAATGETCSAGFCDGLGTCGTCQPGAACSTGNPCEVGTTECAGGNPRCVAAGNVAAEVACGAESADSWSVCTGFGNQCDTTGTQTRSVTSFACDGGGRCAESRSSETRACSRGTDGNSCGAGTQNGAWGACGYADVCDQSASRSRTVTTFRCGGGSCSGTPSTQTESCSRNTNGTSCGANETGPWGPCQQVSGSNPCGTAGQQTRSVATYSCNRGACLEDSSTQTQLCSYDATGDVCPSPLAPSFPCQLYRCVGTSCQYNRDTCAPNFMCCETGCEPSSGGGGTGLCLL